MFRIIVALSLIILVLFLGLFNESTITQTFNSTESYALILKSILTLIFFATTMLNIDTIRALQNTILSEVYRSLLRYIPVFIFAIILIQYNQQPYLVEAYLLGFVSVSYTHLTLPTIYSV